MLNWKGIEIGQHFSLEMALKIHEKEFTIPKPISDGKKEKNMKHLVSPSF